MKNKFIPETLEEVLEIISHPSKFQNCKTNFVINIEINIQVVSIKPDHDSLSVWGLDVIYKFNHQVEDEFYTLPLEMFLKRHLVCDGQLNPETKSYFITNQLEFSYEDAFDIIKKNEHLIGKYIKGKRILDFILSNPDDSSLTTRIDLLSISSEGQLCYSPIETLVNVK